MTLAIIGGGSWGTALSIVLGPRFENLRLWVYETDLAKRLRVTRENDVYLPDLRVPDHVAIVTDLRAALDDAEIVLCVIPSRHARGLYTHMLPHLNPSMIFVSATKGIEDGTLLRMSEVLAEVVRPRFAPRIAVVSGPTFAREVARGEPTALVVASIESNVSPLHEFGSSRRRARRRSQERDRHRSRGRRRTRPGQ
jgi:glycerol-3-phosphate dehydrogenase (NAD(P)+)